MVEQQTEQQAEQQKADPHPPRRAILRVDTLEELIHLIYWAHERRRGWVALTPSDGAGWYIEISILDGEIVEGGRIVQGGMGW